MNHTDTYSFGEVIHTIFRLIRYIILCFVSGIRYVKVSCNFKVLSYHETVFSHGPCAKNIKKSLEPKTMTLKQHDDLSIWPIIAYFIMSKSIFRLDFVEIALDQGRWKTNFGSKKILDSDWIICQRVGLSSFPHSFTHSQNPNSNNQFFVREKINEKVKNRTVHTVAYSTLREKKIRIIRNKKPLDMVD